MAELDQDDESSSGTSTPNSTQSLADLAMFQNMPEPERCAQVYMMHRRFRRTWRRYTGRPMRRYRRVAKRHFRKFYKRPFKGGLTMRNRTFYEQTQYPRQFYPQGHKGKGKGKGRKNNPRGPDGNPMTCHSCGSDEHFSKHCSKGKGAGGTNFVMDTYDHYNYHSAYYNYHTHIHSQIE